MINNDINILKIKICACVLYIFVKCVHLSRTTILLTRSAESTALGLVNLFAE